MQPFIRFLLYWLSTALALWIVDGLFDSLAFDSLQTLFLSALVLALVNVTIKPVLLLVTLPLTIFTLGLAIPLINGVVLLLVSELIEGFTISGFWMGVLCALAISFVGFLIGLATGQSMLRGGVQRGGIHFQSSRGRTPGQETRDARRLDAGVIDVEAREKKPKGDENGDNTL
jgi:putative membrane protein